MEKITRDVSEAHDLQAAIVELVFEYVEDDNSRCSFGINAALFAGVHLVKASSMSMQTRMSVAHTIFQALTDDIQAAYPDVAAQSHSH